jgi:hypothetical protein
MLCAEMQSQPAFIIQFLERQSSSAPLRNTLEEGVAYQMRSHQQDEQDERDERDVMMIVLRCSGAEKKRSCQRETRPIFQLLNPFFLHVPFASFFFPSCIVVSWFCE